MKFPRTSNRQRDNNGEVLIHSKCRKDYTNQRRLDSFLKRRLLTKERLPSSLWNNLTGRNNASTVGLTPVKIKSTRIEILFISQRPFHSETTSWNYANRSSKKVIFPCSSVSPFYNTFYNISSDKLASKIYNKHWVKYARILVFSDIFPNKNRID